MWQCSQAMCVMTLQSEQQGLQRQTVHHSVELIFLVRSPHSCPLRRKAPCRPCIWLRLRLRLRLRLSQLLVCHSGHGQGPLRLVRRVRHIPRQCTIWRSVLV